MPIVAIVFVQRLSLHWPVSGVGDDIGHLFIMFANGDSRSCHLGEFIGDAVLVSRGIAQIAWNRMWLFPCFL